MKINKLLYAFIASLLFLACNQEELPQIDGKVYNASVECLTTKTTLNQGINIHWQEADQVSIFEKSTSNALYRVIKGTEGKTSCSLELVSKAPVGQPIDHVVAFYPYSADITCTSLKGGAYLLKDIYIQSEQIYCSESFASGSFPMLAVNSGDNLSFKNVCGAIKFQVKGDVKIVSVTVKGNQNEKLSGSATVNAYFGALPVIKMAADANTQVVLNCAEGVQLRQDVDTDFILTVPPTEFKSGFTVIFKDNSNKTYTVDTQKLNKVERSSVLAMPSISLTDSDQGGSGDSGSGDSGSGDDDGNGDDTGVDNGNNGDQGGEIPSGIIPFTTATLGHEGISYIWDESVIPEITINMTKDEWNALLALYDVDNHNVEYFHADFTYKKGNETIVIKDGGVRLRGNTSRRRPEGNYGEQHNSKKPDWHHCHFGINFRKFNKDSDHELKGIRKLNLKWFKDDPCYVRELYCYDLFRRYGIWTSAFATYARVWLQIDNETPSYLGVYDMIEPVDDKFVSKRVEGMFKNKGGFLWKCCYGEGGPADLKTDGGNSIPAWKMNFDQDNGVNYTYEFKGDEEDFETAKAQLGDFMQKLNGKGEESFYKWIKEKCNVEFLLKTYAVNVAVGMWDDLWGNGNNYYLYFNTTDRENFEVFFIPYDYDNTLGTSSIVSDAGRQDPYDWGNTGLLMERLMKFDEFKQIYKNALKELVDPANGLFHMDASVPRIKAWQQKISPYVSNDTGEDMTIYDEPAYWGNCGFYRLMDTGSNNYFKVKTETINRMR